MALFDTAYEAWHDACDSADGLQDPYSEKIKGTKPGDQGVREAELAKIKRVINKLPDAQRIAGMWCFGPSSRDETNRYRDKLTQKLWSAAGPKNAVRLKNYQKTVKLQILVMRAVYDAQYRSINDNKSLYSQAQLASNLGISSTSFSESWKGDYEFMVKQVLNDALAGLTEVEKKVYQINALYRQAG